MTLRTTSVCRSVHRRLRLRGIRGRPAHGLCRDALSDYEIISEALRRLPDDLKARHPSIAWKDMAGAGNIYPHDYEDVAAQHVWDAVRDAFRTGRQRIGVEAPEIG